MNIDPEWPLDILRDHEASVELVHGYIRERCSLLPLLQGANSESADLIFPLVAFVPDRLYDGLQAA